MTDTGQVPGEGLPESAGMVEQPDAPAPGAYTYLSETPAEDDDLLLLPGAQGAWGNEVPPPAPEPVQETAHQPGPHEISGRDSGSVDLSGVRLPDPPPIPPITPRRPLHLGPPLPDSSASPVRSLADRGPADAPVRQPAPPTAGPEYLDGPRASEPGTQPAAPWGTPATHPAPVGAGAMPAETVVPATAPMATAQAVATHATTETGHAMPQAAESVPAEASASAPASASASASVEAVQPAAVDQAVVSAQAQAAEAVAGQAPVSAGPDGAHVPVAEQVVPVPGADAVDPGLDAAAGRVSAVQAGLAAADEPAGVVEAPAAEAGHPVPEQGAAVGSDPAATGVGADAGPVAAAEGAAVAAPEQVAPPTAEVGPVVESPAQGGESESAGGAPEGSVPAAAAEQATPVAADQAVAPAPAPEAGQVAEAVPSPEAVPDPGAAPASETAPTPEAVPLPEATAVPDHAAVTPPEAVGAEAAAPEAAAEPPAADVAPAPEPVAPEPDVTAEAAAPQPPAATDAVPVAQEPEASAPQPTTPAPVAPGHAAMVPAAEPAGQEAAAPAAEPVGQEATVPAAETVPAPEPTPAAEGVAPAETDLVEAPEPVAQAGPPADAPAPAGPATPAAPGTAQDATASAQVTATAPGEVPAEAPEPTAQAPEAPVPTPTPAPTAEAVEPDPTPQAAGTDTPAPTPEDVTVVLPAPPADEQPGQSAQPGEPVQGPQQSQPVATNETPEPHAPAVTVPAPRDGDAELVQNADDLDTRGAEQEDLADQERREESAAAVAEARQSTGPAAPGYDPAEREAVLKVMRERRDIRNGFRNDPIPHEVLLRVLEAAHHAPSVGHSQPWDFVVIRSADTRRAMHELAMRQRDAYAKSLPKGRAKQFKELKIEAILDTPVNIVVTADPTRGGRHTLGRHTQPQMAPYSAALAVENLWLAARAEGLGVGWVSFFDEREMVRALGLPEHLEIIAYLCVGYVDAFPDEPELLQAGWSKRRPLSWVVHEETYGRRALPGEEPHDLLAETVAQIRPLDAKALGEAWERQKRMTKPAGALGMLEIISAQLSGLSRQCPPPIPEPAAVAIFAGDHGVHAQGVTPWPQEVTAQMVANFLGGGAVCNAFATQVGAEVCIVDVGVAADLPATPGLLPRKIRAGTSDLTTGPAMTREEAKQAIEVGIETARDLVAAGNKALLTGEMGIANTTASAALISVFTGADPAEVTGRGTGINDETLARKTEVVRRALELHQPDPADPLGVLAAIGGFEHAAIVGLLLGGASLRTPVILDGVSAGAAALVARAIAPEVLAACIAGHRSAEPGHVAALNKLGLRPLVDLDLRLGEGTGALLALPLVQSTARAMHEVATFDSAGVTEK
ncbi:nicotinate-nucleotide--dimethylbenzimidazole phosphoribosyltransferase [Streptomyces sp. NPDC007907]|uniref:nicotinate-nucleotide--dimethylbenzimidazole phosphoribosyltransferase n=1 Tax=Streptomyces sp. NPDC007907 TaxID=3364789 RepID=UPI0036E57ADB